MSLYQPSNRTLMMFEPARPSAAFAELKPDVP
jgi:hypothetical protein